MKAVQEQQQPESMESNESIVSSNDYAYRPLTSKQHRRAGSTGTTGDEEYTTDEEEPYADETDRSLASSLHPSHPILKSDLARAATDLFGYAVKPQSGPETEPAEPTSLFDEDDSEFLADSCSTAKRDSLFAYHEKRYMYRALSRHQRLPPTSQGNRQESESSEKPEDDSKRSSNVFGFPPDFREQEAGTDNKVNAATNEQASVVSSCCVLGKDARVDSVPGRECGTPEPNCTGRPASPTTLQWGRAVAEVKGHAVANLQEELRRAHEELKLKDEEVARLSRIRQDVEIELEELTASLFQEAHNMVREANLRQAAAERLLEESRMKAEVLAAEVAALKTLVLTSTPARPNPHLHPQIDTKSRSSQNSEDGGQQQGLFAKKHRRSPSHFNLKYGRENSPPGSPVKEQRPSLPTDREGFEREWKWDRENERDNEKEKKEKETDREKECCSGKDFGLEVDPSVHSEFLKWKANPCVDRIDPFVGRVFREDIDLCLDFPNQELGSRVRQAVLDGIIFIEAVSDKAKLAFPKKCALLQASRQCYYRMRLGDQENQWYSISQICRNRIIAVCDFLNYLRYVERGLVKSSVHDVYWEITRLRKEMVFARLGLALSS